MTRLRTALTLALALVAATIAPPARAGFLFAALPSNTPTLRLPVASGVFELEATDPLAVHIISGSAISSDGLVIVNDADVDGLTFLFPDPIVGFAFDVQYRPNLSGVDLTLDLTHSGRFPFINRPDETGNITISLLATDGDEFREIRLDAPLISQLGPIRVLAAVPEPSTLAPALAGAGALGLLAWRRRRPV